MAHREEANNLWRNVMKTLERSFFVILFLALLNTSALPQGASDSKLIEGAKKENRLVHWTTMTLSQSKQVVDAFQNKYPFIETDLFAPAATPCSTKSSVRIAPASTYGM